MHPIIIRVIGTLGLLLGFAMQASADDSALGGFGALSMVKQARDLLEQAERVDASALQGSIYTSLGSLYYQVPGWPLGFGDDERAEALLQKALEAPLRPNRPVADAGRCDEASRALAEVRTHLASN